MEQITEKKISTENARKKVVSDKVLQSKPTFCIFCNSGSDLVPFKNRHICRDCIDMTKRFQEWNQQFD